MNSTLIPDSNDLSAYAGTPNSIARGLNVTPLDTSHIDEEIARENELDRRAKEIYDRGNALEYIRHSCSKIHAGDGNIITALILSAALLYVINSNGLHICITGQAGTGKSHVAETVKKHLPQCRILDARISDKSLFYHQERVKEGQIIHLDDQGLSETFEEIYKKISTDWTKPATLLTVKDNKPLELMMPPRLVFWFTKMEGVGDEQTKSRLLMFETSEDREQFERIRKAQIATAMDPKLSIDTTDQEISQRIWNYFSKEYVVIPYLNDIESNDTTDPRNYNMMLELTRASAILSAPLRNRSREGYLEASVKDFEIAAQIMNPLLSNYGGSQKLKLGPDANRLLKVLSTLETGNYTFRMLQEISGFTYQQVRRGISGRDGNDQGGLEHRCPAVTTAEMTYSISGGSTRLKSISWNRERYEKWRLDNAGLFNMDTSKILFWETNEESKRKQKENTQ